MFRDNHQNPRIIPSLSKINIYYQNINELNNTQLAYIGLEPKSSHTIKYSQPLELVLFHVTPFTFNDIKVLTTRIY